MVNAAPPLLYARPLQLLAAGRDVVMLKLKLAVSTPPPIGTFPAGHVAGTPPNDDGFTVSLAVTT